MRTGPKTSGSPRGYRRRRHRPREVWSSPQRWTDGLGGRRDGRWPSRTPRTGSRWWLWYRPMCPPDPESEGFRRPSDREDIDYRVRGQLGLVMEEARSLNTFFAQLPTRGILRSSHSGHSRKFPIAPGLYSSLSYVEYRRGLA